jgi:hypothetical protein
MSDEEINLLYYQIEKNTADLLGCNYNPMAIAGVMMAQALSMYKTCLTEEEYHKMVDFISSNRENVKLFETPRIQ